MRVHVALTPTEPCTADLAIVVDVLRATSTISQALASGYRNVLCCGSVDEARVLAAGHDSRALAGERECVRIPGFDLGNSPAEMVDPTAQTLVLTTTNGTGALLAAARGAREVLAASMLNLAAVTSQAALAASGDVVVLCAGVLGRFALDDAYCAGRVVERLDGERTDAARAAVRLAESYETHEAGLSDSQSARNLVAAELADDIALCARESVLDVVPRVVGTSETAVEIASA